MTEIKQPFLNETTRRVAKNLLFAEGAGMAVGYGASMGLESFFEKWMNSIRAGTYKHIVRPHMGAWDFLARRLPYMLDEPKKTLDPQTSTHERATDISNSLVRYLPPTIIDYIVSFGVQKHLENQHSEGKELGRAKIGQALIHLGAVWVVNTPLNTPISFMVEKTKKVCTKIGFSEKSSDDIANYLFRLGVPDMIGLLAGVGLTMASPGNGHASVLKK